MADSNTSAVIDELSQFDVEWLEGLLEEYRAPLLDFAQRQIPASLRGLIDPQDVLQDVFYEAFRRLKQFDARDGGSAFRWLMTITKHRIIKLVRAEFAVKRGGKRIAQGWKLVGNDESLALMLAELAIYERTPSESAMAHELALALGQSISQLPPDYQRAIRLRYIERQDVDVIAVALGRTHRAVHMVCNRALKALRLELGSKSRFV